MSYVLQAQLTPDKFGSVGAGVLLCPGTSRLLITVRTPASSVPGTAGAGAVVYQLGHGTGAAPQWEPDERLLLPGTLGRSIVCDAVRVRSLAPGVPQYVAIEAD